MGPYSELEYLILALVGEGVCSGYAIRKSMNRMPGGRWSADSGSVYRVLRRLEIDGLVLEARRVGIPKRERTEYALTPAGDSTLHTWLSLPPSRSEFWYLVDPLRTRSYFLTRMSPADQLRIVKSWIQDSKEFLADLRKDVASNPYGDGFKKAGYENLLFLAEARHEWLKKLYSLMKSAGS